MKKQSSSMERAIKARCGLLIREPFFGTLALRLELVEDKKVKVMTTDGKQLRFNPAWVEDVPLPELEAVIAHNVFHCALLHHLRRDGRDNASWQDATDHAVNHELSKAGFQLPEGSLMDPQYQGMTSESIYDLIYARKQEAQDQQKKDSEQQKSTDGQGQAPSTPAEGSGGTGESATGKVEDAKDEDGDPVDEANVEAEANDWQQAVAQAAQAAKGVGNMPGNVERSIQSTLRPKVNWSEALQRLVQSRTKDDYDWGKPNKRFHAYGLYLPSLDSPRCGTLAFAMDGSGSITQRHFDQFGAEIMAAAQMLRPEKIVVMIFDTEVKQVFEFEADDLIELTAPGRGGTKFDGPVLKLEEMEVEPEVLVYLTDLDSHVWPQEPSYPVVWVTTRPGVAPFGEVIEMH